MLEKTKIFLKKEIGKRAEPNDDSYTALWKEKAEIPWAIFSEYFAYQNAINYSEDGKQRRTKLQENLSEYQNVKRNDRELWLAFGYDHSGKDDDYIKTLKLFFSPKYESPDDIYKKLFHTVVIYRYYRNLLPSIGIPSWTIDAKVDLALLKLTLGISAEIHTMDSQITKSDRATPGGDAMKESGAVNKKDIADLLEELGVSGSLQFFRKNKNIKKIFLAKAEEKTGLDKKTIYDKAREILEEKRTITFRYQTNGFDTKPSV